MQQSCPIAKGLREYSMVPSMSISDSPDRNTAFYPINQLKACPIWKTSMYIVQRLRYMEGHILVWWNLWAQFLSCELIELNHAIVEIIDVRIRTVSVKVWSITSRSADCDWFVWLNMILIFRIGIHYISLLNSTNLISKMASTWIEKKKKRHCRDND